MAVVSYEKKFWDILENIFVGAEVEGEKSGYVNLLRVKRNYFKNYLSHKLLNHIENKLAQFPEFKEELYDKLYSFFHRYFSESGSIYFSYTPLYYKIYEKVYYNDGKEAKEIITYNTDYEQILSDKEDVALFWKTHMLYYIKTDRIIRSMGVKFPEENPEKNIAFYFDAKDVEPKKGNEKKQLAYELVNNNAENKTKENNTEDKTIVLKVLYSENGKKTKLDYILKQLKKKYRNITEETLKKAIRTFEKQLVVDYFINKNPKKFLKQQFDLWMYQYLFLQEVSFDLTRFNQLQVLKDVAYKIIEFISQFEDELRKIWEKPRLVFNSNYVITLDRIANKENGIEIIKQIVNQLKEQKADLDKLKKLKDNHRSYIEIIEDYTPENQIEEWYLLDIIDESFNVDEILKEDSLNKKYQFLPIDTKYFKWLKGKIEEIFNIYDENGDLDGRLIKSENFQALNTILPRFKGKIHMIYIDPPYNTTNNEFIYEDRFKQSSWLTFMENRLSLAKQLLSNDGTIYISIDNHSLYHLKLLLDNIFGKENFMENLIWRRRAGGGNDSKYFALEHEYILTYKRGEPIFNGLDRNLTKYEKDEKGFYLIKPLNEPTLQDSPGLHYDIECPDGTVLKGSEHQWKVSYDKFKKMMGDGDIIFKKNKNGRYTVYYKHYVNLEKGIRPFTILYNLAYNSTATKEMNDLFGNIINKSILTTPKPIKLIQHLMKISTDKKSIILDFFAGTGTTAEALIRLNEEDGGKRKFIIIEVSSFQFEKIIIPRIKKIAFSSKWDKGKPVLQKGYSLFVKYYELEQYEDILETIEYSDTEVSEYYEKLKEVLKDDFTFSKANPFIFDRKLSKVLCIEGNNLKFDFSKLYDKDIDIRETIFLQNCKDLKNLIAIGE